jgi:hypothetical protein
VSNRSAQRSRHAGGGQSVARPASTGDLLTTRPRRYDGIVEADVRARECYFATCDEPAAVEAIGTYDGVFGLDETVPLVLCDRHASLLRDHVIVLSTS